MENRLKKLFEYQKFEKNPKLEALITETHARCAEALSDDDLEMVAAAGDATQQNQASKPGILKEIPIGGDGPFTDEKPMMKV